METKTTEKGSMNCHASARGSEAGKYGSAIYETGCRLTCDPYCQHHRVCRWHNMASALKRQILLPDSKPPRATAPVATIGKQETIEAALCCGRIDALLQKLDEHHYMVRMKPRRAGGLWSARNQEAAERLVAEGNARPAGISQIEAAKSYGRWQNADVPQRSTEPPEDLLNALNLSAVASRLYQALDRANRYTIIYRVRAAKKLEPRTKLITRFVEMLARRETVHGQMVYRMLQGTALMAKKSMATNEDAISRL
jgi:uncharacterized protein YdeI (YjbR/CyaY-like superfamily)